MAFVSFEFEKGSFFIAAHVLIIAARLQLLSDGGGA